MNYQKMSDAAKASAIPEELDIVSADQIKLEAIDWLWPGRFALGKFGVIGGNPDRGKGLILADIFARITGGRPWPCNEGNAPIGDALLLQQEDDLSDTVAPRLRAAGADMSRVKILRMVRKTDGSGKRMFDLHEDLPKLRDALERANEPQLLAIDPLTAYVGKINASAGIEVRSILMPLVEMLADFHIAGIGVMHFNKKTDVEQALARIADSVAFGAVARHCFVVTDDAENERRLLVKAEEQPGAGRQGVERYH
jgi:putative DNA primase/helicase